SRFSTDPSDKANSVSLRQFLQVSEFANSGVHFVAMPCCMFDVLDAATVGFEQTAECCFAFYQWQMSEVLAAEHQQIKCAGKSRMVVLTAVKFLESWNTLVVGAHNLRIHDRCHLESHRFLHNERITLRPVGTVHREETHAAVADMDPQAIAVMLQLVRPTRTAWRLLGDGWLARINESGRRV